MSSVPEKDGHRAIIRRDCLVAPDPRVLAVRPAIVSLDDVTHTPMFRKAL